MKNVTYELEPIYSSVQSFYRKAFVKETDKFITLYSYETPVVKIDKKNDTFKYLWGSWSMTTGRHVIEFLQQNGFGKLNKKEVLKHC